jgi:hypothetical protein
VVAVSGTALQKWNTLLHLIFHVSMYVYVHVTNLPWHKCSSDIEILSSDVYIICIDTYACVYKYKNNNLRTAEMNIMHNAHTKKSYFTILEDNWRCMCDFIVQ